MDNLKNTATATKTLKQPAQVVMGSSPEYRYRAVELLWAAHQQFNSKADCALSYTSQVFLLAGCVYDKQDNGGYFENRLHETGHEAIALYVGNMLNPDNSQFTVLTMGIGGNNINGGANRYSSHNSLQEAQDHIIKWAKRYSVDRFKTSKVSC